MSKYADQIKWYKEGRQAALAVAREAAANGEDVLKKLESEIGYADRLKLPPNLTKKQWQEAFKEMQTFTIDSMILVSMAALFQNENWGADKLMEFAETLNTYADAIADGSIDWDGIKEMLVGEGVEVVFG